METSILIWEKKLLMLENYLKKHNEIPSKKNDSVLYDWYRKSTNRYKDKRLLFENIYVCKRWEKFLKLHQKYIEENNEFSLWKKKLNCLNIFVGIHNRLPLNIPYENILRTWVNKEINKHKQGKRTFELFESFINKTKVMCLNYDTVEDENFKEIFYYSQTDDDITTEKIYKLSVWRSLQKKNTTARWLEFLKYPGKNFYKFGENNRSLIKYYIDLDLFHDEEITNIGLISEWLNTFKILNSFIIENDIIPAHDHSCCLEEKLFKWTTEQNFLYLTRTDIMELDEIYNKWEFYLSSDRQKFIDAKWNDMFEKLLKKIPGDEESHIWEKKQNNNYRKKSRTMRDKVKYEKWSIYKESTKLTIEDKWFNKFNQLKDYIILNKLTYPLNSKNLKNEQLLNWFNTQQSNYKKNKHSMKNINIFTEWNIFYYQNNTLEYY